MALGATEQKRAWVPRFTQGNCLEQRRKFKVQLVAAAKFESDARTISQWTLCNILCSLPRMEQRLLLQAIS
jgi:hypothetical protein